MDTFTFNTNLGLKMKPYKEVKPEHSDTFKTLVDALLFSDDFPSNIINKKQFDVNEAKLYGVKCAVLLEFIRSKGGTIKMGLHEISDALPFLNLHQVRRGLKKLVVQSAITCYRSHPVTYSLNKTGEK